MNEGWNVDSCVKEFSSVEVAIVSCQTTLKSPL